MKINLEDLYNCIVNEAPVSQYLTRPTSQAYRNRQAQMNRQAQQQYQQSQQQQSQQPKQPSFTSRLGSATKAAAPGVLSGTKELAKGVGGVAGEVVKNISGIPGAVKTAREFFLGKDPAGMVHNKLRGKEEHAAAPDTEEFDKDTVKAILMGQTTPPTKQTGTTPTTTSGAIQAPGTVTGGSAVPASASGTTSGSMQAGTATPAKTTNLSIAMRDPKPGDLFTVPGEYGKLNRYKVDKVKGDIVTAKKHLG